LLILILTLTNKVQSQHLNTSGTFLDKKGGLFVATVEKDKSDLVSIKIKKYLLNKKTKISTSVVASDYNIDTQTPVKILETSNGTLYVVFLTKPVVHANPNPFKMSDDVSSKTILIMRQEANVLNQKKPRCLISTVEICVF
jgi:hypothetical protein